MNTKRVIRRFTFVITVLVMMFQAGGVFGAATCLVNKDTINGMTVLEFIWTSHTDGIVASGTCDETTSVYLGRVSGIILGVKFQPDASTAPTDAYDVVINTAGGADILHGQGANLTNDDSNTGQWQSPVTADGDNIILYQENLDLVITNAGSGKLGKIFLFLF